MKTKKAMIDLPKRTPIFKQIDLESKLIRSLEDEIN